LLTRVGASAQGYDLQTATNIYGPLLLSVLLHDVLARTTAKAETASVRVMWTASHAADLFGPPGGVHFIPDPLQPSDEEKFKIKEDFAGGPSYAQSKACDIILGVECAKRCGADGIISTSLNPGNCAANSSVIGVCSSSFSRSGLSVIRRRWGPGLNCMRGGVRRLRRI
jgi:NAD(P)-dependent dehydrogenase (short-subunit alcohol dehydrogenase family)